ncbi:MAG TPA: hypothetical protein VGT05_04235 [Patescibacteria group bacterium]|nr:hypothetical protein [Patescibacteria group bacterium]
MDGDVATRPLFSAQEQNALTTFKALKILNDVFRIRQATERNIPQNNDSFPQQDAPYLLIAEQLKQNAILQELVLLLPTIFLDDKENFTKKPITEYVVSAIIEPLFNFDPQEWQETLNSLEQNGHLSPDNREDPSAILLGLFQQTYNDLQVAFDENDSILSKSDGTYQDGEQNPTGFFEQFITETDVGTGEHERTIITPLTRETAFVPGDKNHPAKITFVQRYTTKQGDEKDIMTFTVREGKIFFSHAITDPEKHDSAQRIP